MFYESKAARDAALGLNRDRVPGSAASRQSASSVASDSSTQRVQPLVTADGQQVVVRVECTHPPIDTRTIAWGIVRGWFYIMVIVVVLSLLLAIVGVNVDLSIP